MLVLVAAEVDGYDVVTAMGNLFWFVPSDILSECKLEFVYESFVGCVYKPLQIKVSFMELPYLLNYLGRNSKFKTLAIYDSENLMLNIQLPDIDGSSLGKAGVDASEVGSTLN